MTDQLEADTQHEELIELGKSLGLTQAANMKPETLKKRIAEAQKQSKQLDSLQIEMDDETKQRLIDVGFNFEHFKMRCKEYRINRAVYDRKRKAFGLFVGNQLVDFLDSGAF